MKNEVTLHEINGRKILKVRQLPRPTRVIKSKKAYNRKEAKRVVL